MKITRTRKLFSAILLVAFLVSMIGVAPVSAATVGLVGEWNLDEGIGSKAADSSANLNDGVLSGGKFGNALFFDGDNDYITIPDSASLDSVIDLTIELWVKPSVNYVINPLFYVFASKYTDSSSFQFVYHPGGFLYLYITNGIAVQSEPLTLTAGTWYHLAATFDSGTNNGKIFVDGVDRTLSTLTRTMTQNNMPFCIGVRADTTLTNPNHEVKGTLDEIRLSNNIRYPGSFSPQTSPFETDGNTIGLWHFDESVGSTAPDSSGNNNQGTIVNAKWAGPTWVPAESALQFDGVNDYVEVGDVGVTGDWTIAFEVKVASAGAVIQYPISMGPAGYQYNTGIFVVFNWEDQKWGIYDGLNYYLGSPLSLNTWYSLIVTKSGTTYSIYKDGAFENSGTLDDMDITNLQFGRRVDPGGVVPWYFNGMLRAVQIFDYALDELTLAFDPTSAAVAPINTAADIRAIVTDASGNTVEGAAVSLASSAGLTLSSSGGSTGADGKYAFIAQSATAGIYEVTASMSTIVGPLEAVWTIVIYDPSAGFVTGGGWIDSAAGAYKIDTELTGKATFGFVSKYQKGATIPTGNTEFVFHVAGMRFKSASYEWLVVTGENTAKFKGVGTINGEGEYKFQLWAFDGGKGGTYTFRIKIWTETNGAENVVYDNGSDQAILGGSIIVHK